MMKNNFLIIDSSSSTLKIGIKIYEKKLSIDYKDDFHHLENIIPLISDLLKRVGYETNSIKNILVCNGPGSFTGIRIGIATAYGIFCAMENVNCFGFNIFDVYKFLLNEENSVIIPILDAKKDRFYCSFIESDKEYKFFDFTKEEIIEKIKNNYNNKKLIFAGKDFNLIKDKIFIKDYEYKYENDFDSNDLINFGEYFINSHLKKDFPEPLYIRKSEAELYLLHKKGVL